jgi:hypothetical protein
MLEVWRQWLNRIFNPESRHMSKTKSTHVHATKEGGLYVKPSELFTAPKVQDLIKKMLNSEVLKEATQTNQGTVNQGS